MPTLKSTMDGRITLFFLERKYTAILLRGYNKLITITTRHPNIKIIYNFIIRKFIIYLWDGKYWKYEYIDNIGT